MHIDLSKPQIMLDLETLSTRPDAGIIAIGACVFDEDGIGAEFYAVPSLRSVQESGAHIDIDTIAWWMRQSDEARQLFQANTSMTIEQCLRQFSGWMENNGRGAPVWANGANFDTVILRTAFQRAGINTPWSPFLDRCHRTVKNMAKHIDIDRAGTHHNALDDSRNQADQLIRIVRDHNQRSAA